MAYDIIIIGAGIVGLATGLKLLEKNPELKVLFLEKENAIAKHQTGNNSGVIHSGIYYKPGSLKAQNCIRGYKMLIDFCQSNQIDFKICGKIILATAENELPVMRNIFDRGIQNGLSGLKILNKNELKDIEPNANGVGAIWVPQTGITNYTQVSQKYLEISLSRGAKIKFDEKVESISLEGNGSKVFTKNNCYSTRMIVTCTGLYSDRIAKLTHPNLDFRLIPFRGEYYKLRKQASHLVKNLIYPVPNPSFPFLGVHFTRMIDGNFECGPNAVLAFKREGYNKMSFNLVDSFEIFSWPGFQKVMMKYWGTGLGEFYRSYNKSAFVKALQKLVPEINKSDLEKGGAGIRAQACMRDGTLLDDFYIIEQEKIIHVCNAPSPAATASLAIGDYLSKTILERLK